MRKNTTFFNKFEWRILLGLIGLTVTFFIPLLAGWGRFFFDDIAFLFYPQQVFLARCLSKGDIPWWDPHICAGATPFYTRLFASYLYPLNWPFLLLGNADRVRNYFWMVQAPLVLHYLFSAVSSYLFARSGLRLCRAGSFILALAYTFSPTMIYMATFPPEVFIQAWLPLICLFLISFARTGRWSQILLGALAFGVASTGGDVPFVSHVVMITGLFGGGLLVLALIKRDWLTGGRIIIGGVVIFFLGFLISGIYWSNMLEGLRLLKEGTADEMASLSGINQSMHPLYLITLFIPDFFGGVTSAHTWGAAYHIHLSLNDANLMGGIASLFLVFMGAVTLFRRRGNSGEVFSSAKLWVVFAGIAVFGLFVVMGRYTPIHKLAQALIPMLRMPYPVRFRSIECFALAGLMGISLTLIQGMEYKKRGRYLFFFLAFIIIFVIQALIFPYQEGAKIFSPGWKHLTHLNDWAWFIRGPILYLLIAGGVLGLGIWLLKEKAFMRLLVLLISAELLFFAYGAFYQNRILNRRNRDFSADRYCGPNDHRIYRTFLEWGRQIGGAGDSYRRLYSRSYFDNLAWVYGSLSMLGFDIKPLDPRFQSILEELTEGFPNEILVADWGSRFWPNMSVKTFISSGPIQHPLFREPGSVDGYRAYSLRGALPRVYFQDRWVLADDRAQKEALLEGDLRLRGFCNAGFQTMYIGNRESKLPMNDEGIKHFDQLQETNRILSTDFSNPNRVILDVDIAEAVMLVMTDLWHSDWSVTIDDKDQPLYRVNYLQRGLWCTPGEHRVIMEFRPSTLKWGIIMTMVGIVGLVVIIIVSRRQVRRKTAD